MTFTPWEEERFVEEASMRHLQQTAQEYERGRTVLTILYLTVLSLCFVLPILYYFRIHCEDRNARAIRELEAAARMAGMEQQPNEENRDEMRAVRKKYREEKRARIVQLFTTVQKTLVVDDFPHRRHASAGEESQVEKKCSPVDMKVGSLEIAPMEGSDNIIMDTDEDKSEENDASDIEQGNLNLSAWEGRSDGNWSQPFDDPYAETAYIELPPPGLSLSKDASGNDHDLRLVPSLCAICLSNYEVGDDVVWSSNAACEHVFHEQCIEKWLMKQRGDPLCPCCRRDFVIDPFDVEEESLDVATNPS